ncbi:reverse transcriptase domain-containing protein, partial [Tanacetum coccineum]
MRYGLLRMLRRRQSLLTPNIPKAKLLHVRMVHWNSWGDEDGCTKGPQLEEGENLNTGAPGTGRTLPGGTSAPAGQTQGGLSLAFVKENSDVLRTMIKELDSRGQEKSRSRGRPRSAQKHRKSVSKKKGSSKSYRLVRSEARSRSKSKSVKSKPQSVRASRRKSSSDSGYDTMSDSGSEDLSMPYRRPKPIPFTPRITRFIYHRRAKPSKDPEDHLSIFSAAAEQEEWPMPVWCKMFRQTLSGSVRNWFNSLIPKSVDGFEELSNKFLEEFSQQKRYDKDPTEIHGIKRKPNEGLQAFMTVLRQKVHTSKECLRWHSSGERRPQIRPKPSGLLDEKRVLEILAMDNVNFPPPPPMVGTSEK